MTEETTLPENVEGSQVSNLSQVTVDTVRAELVRMHQSSAHQVQGEDVELNMSAAASVNSTRVSATSSALAATQAEEIITQNSVIGAAQAERMSLGGVAGVVVAGSADLDHVHVGFLAGREVRAERIDTVILLSRHVEGNVTTLMDTRQVWIAGLLGGLFAGTMLLLGRRLFGRK
jgi:hypothetical protein